VALAEVAGPAVSKHLAVLERSKLVTHVCVGNRSLYRLDTRGLEESRQYLDDYSTDVLSAFARPAEAEEGHS
jgi:DNA-binding transcriptional ArsR family regulator